MFKATKAGEVVFTKDKLMCAALDTAESADSVSMMTNEILQRLDDWQEAVGNDGISDAWIEDLRVHLLREQALVCRQAASAMAVVSRMK